MIGLWNKNLVNNNHSFYQNAQAPVYYFAQSNEYDKEVGYIN